MKPTIITLTPRQDSSNTVRVATFEEAFGEFSEARGRGRERRAKRRADRQKKRQEARMRRINMRAERKRARQSMRAEQQEARQTRKDTRKSRRVNRKNMGEQEDPQEEQSQSQEQGGDDSQGGGESQGDDNSQGGVVADEQVQEQGGNGEGEAESTEEGQVEEAEQEEGGEEESGFNGEDELLGAEDTYDSELRGAEDYYLNVDGQMTKINPKVAEVTKRIAYNKDTLSRLEMRLTNVQTIDEREKVLTHIARRKARIKELEGMLEGYSSAKGRGKHESNRRREVRKAKHDAKKKLRRERNEAKKERRKGLKEDGGSETSVEKDLNPDISEQRIEVPASEEGTGFNGGTGLIGVDDNQDFDAPAVRKFDLKFSGADGVGTTKPKTNWTAIAIGVGVGVLAIYLIKKYKVLEAK